MISVYLLLDCVHSARFICRIRRRKQAICFPNLSVLFRKRIFCILENNVCFLKIRACFQKNIGCLPPKNSGMVCVVAISEFIVL